MDNLANKNNQYSPSSLARVYAQSVAHDLRNKLITVYGIYKDKSKYPQKGGKNSGCYGGFYYDALVDQTVGNELVLKIHRNLKEKIKDGNIYSFKGNLENKLRIGNEISLGVLFVPDQILSEETFDGKAIRQRDEAGLYEKKKLRTGYDVDKTLLQLFHSGKRPRIYILYGNNGIVDSDVVSALRGTGKAYLLRDARISFANEDTIMTELKKMEGHSDVIAVVRGGGSGLEVFNSIRLANAVLDMKVPVVAAIGHDQDDTLVKRMADKAFSTPTAFGNYLREMALGVGEDKEVKVCDDVKKQGNWGIVLGILIVIGMLLFLFGRN